MNFLGGATSLDSFLKAYKTKETKGFFPYECLDCPEKMNNKLLPPYDSFFSILRNSNPLEKDYSHFRNLVNNGLRTEQAVIKLRMDRIPPTGAEIYSYLQSVWEDNNIQFSSDFLKWYNNKNFVPTLEALQKMVEFYPNKGIHMVKPGCTLPNLANICLHKSTDSKFYPSTMSDKVLLEKIREDMIGGTSFVFTRKTVVDETFIRKSSNLCKSIVGVDASQPMPTGLCTRWEYNSETKRFTARQNKSRSLENMVMSYFQQSRPECKIESNVTTGRQEKIDCFSVDGICYHCNTVFEAMGCYHYYCPSQEARHSLRDTDIERGLKRRQQDEMRGDYIQQKGYQTVGMWECEWWSLYKTGDASIKGHLRENFPYRHPLGEEQLLQGIIDGRFFGYVQCGFEVPEHLRSYFSNFLPIFKNTVVSREDIGTLMREYAEKENEMPQPRRMLISSFILLNGTLITPLLLFCLKLGLVCKKIHRFVQNTPRKCRNNFVQSAVDAPRQGDKSPNSSVVAETMKLLANSSCGYQIMDRSRHTVIKYLNDEKTHSAINSKMFKRLNHITNQLYEVELVKLEIEQRTNHCWILYLTICKTENVGTFLQFLQKVWWRWQEWRTWKGYRLALLSFIQRKFGRCHSSRKTSRLVPVTF